MYEIFAFYLFSALSISCIAISVFSKNILHAITSLAGGMIFISALFFILGAEFLGVVQIIVYAGAVMVLYAFSMMFFNISEDVKEKRERLIYFLILFIAIIIVAIFCAPIFGENMKEVSTLDENLNNIQVLGILLFSRYLLAFELVALLLLVSMVAAIVLILKSKNKETL